MTVQMHHRIGTLKIDIEFSLNRPWTVLFGPSGSGKSTILRAIAGLVQPDSGRITWMLGGSPKSPNDIVLTVFDASRNRCMRTHERSTPLAPQAAGLFPHLSVIDNVGYKFRRQTEASQGVVDAALSLFRLGSVANKRPAELSGGEAQRVNLARAAVAAEEDGVLLLDEPFTGLDARLRSDLMRDLQAWAADRNLCVLSVTHDVAEAFQLAAEVIKLAEGRVVDQGPVERVLATERTRLLEQLNGAAGSPA
jgi:molybdate transport system ATP-binding protein